MNIDPALIPAFQQLISQGGGNPNMIADDGSISPDALVQLFFNQAEVRTSISPPIVFPIGPTGQPASPGSDALIRKLQPTVILSGPAGRVEIAPYGEATGEGSWWPIALVGGAVILGIGWLAWRA